MQILLYTCAVLLLNIGLTVFCYLDRVYDELGRVTTGRLRANLEAFEAEVEPKFRLERRRAAHAFRLLSHLWLVVVVVATARGVLIFVPAPWDALAQLVVYILAEAMLFAHFVPELLLARTRGQWLGRVAPVIRGFLIVVWPLRAIFELAISLTHLDDEEPAVGIAAQQEGLEALVEAAEEEGILEGDDAHLIEQVVEFGDKRVHELMTPRPDVVAIPGTASIEQLRKLLVQTRCSRLPVYGESLDDVLGMVYARDLLELPDQESRNRSVRELIRPALFVPETKRGSELLKELQRKHEQIAVVVDEHGLLAGVVTLEDLVEEIVGEIGEEGRAPAPDVFREADGSLVMRGSVALEKVEELFGVEFDTSDTQATTTVAGLLNHIVGHVPVAGERVDYQGLRFEVLEANQRKVLRLRVRRSAAVPAS
ncbi:MAG TPA: hemolysin family protein [Methylomirabilota bacterium]|nr:hemolysin family protein [Methylomirabilota bacterium]